MKNKKLVRFSIFLGKKGASRQVKQNRFCKYLKYNICNKYIKRITVNMYITAHISINERDFMHKLVFSI